MRYIKSITQQKLSFLLAIYIGLFMNGAVFYRRFGSYAHDFTVWKGISAVVELTATVLVTFFYYVFFRCFTAAVGVFWHRWWCSFPPVPAIT